MLTRVAPTFALIGILLSLCFVDGNRHDTIDMCRCLHPSRRVSASTHLLRFTRDLAQVRYRLSNNLANFINSMIRENIECSDDPVSSRFQGGNDLIADMLDAYQNLTETAVELKVFNHINTRDIMSYRQNHIKTAVCHLFRVLVKLDYEVPCSACRMDNSYPAYDLRTNSISACRYVKRTLREAILTIDAIRIHFGHTDCRL